MWIFILTLLQNCPLGQVVPSHICSLIRQLLPRRTRELMAHAPRMTLTPKEVSDLMYLLIFVKSMMQWTQGYSAAYMLMLFPGQVVEPTSMGMRWAKRLFASYAQDYLKSANARDLAARQDEMLQSEGVLRVVSKTRLETWVTSSC